MTSRTPMRSVCACACATSLVACAVALQAATVYADPPPDLRLDTRVRPGPLRELVEPSTEDDAADAESLDEPPLEPIAPASPIPEPPSATPTQRQTPGLASAAAPPSSRGQNAENLYGRLSAGLGVSAMLGGRVRPTLALAAGFSLRFGAPWATPRDDTAPDFRVYTSLLVGSWIDWYPRNGPFHLMTGLALSRVSVGPPVDRLLPPLLSDGYTTLGPALDLGVGAQWRPSGTFGRFRLGLLLDSSASTVMVGNQRTAVIDLVLQTTITWF